MVIRQCWMCCKHGPYPLVEDYLGGEDPITACLAELPMCAPCVWGVHSNCAAVLGAGLLLLRYWRRAVPRVVCNGAVLFCGDVAAPGELVGVVADGCQVVKHAPPYLVVGWTTRPR